MTSRGSPRARHRFNSTLIALLLSLLLMFLLHHLQSEQERLVRDAESYLDERLLLSLRAA